MNTRQATATTVFPVGGGADGKSPMLVRKGEVVCYSPYVNARRKSLYGPDCDLFRPERWENGEMSNIGWSYFPFNGGPRQCLGEDFAIMEVSYTIVRLLQAYKVIEMPPNEIIEPVGTEKQRMTLVLTSVDGCRVRLHRD